MCEANVYLIDREGIIPGEEGIFLENIFSQRKTIRAKIKEMELVNHKIILEAEK